MSLIIPIMGKFWDLCAVKDAKLHATQTEPEGIKRIYDIPYIADGDTYHLFDVYYPEESENEKLPVIIDIHGGGWMYATKDLNRIYNLNLAKRGFTVFSMSYRLVPRVTVYEQLKDVMEALKFIGEHLGGYPCDVNNIMLTGDSAGGMLAAYAAALLTGEKLRAVFDTVNPDMKLTALLLTSPCPYMKTAGIMSVYSRKMWGKDFKTKAGYNYMDFDEIAPLATFPPTCLITSSGDVLALTQTRRAAALLRSMGVETKLMDFPKYEGKNLQHVFSVLEPHTNAGREAIDGALDFYRRFIK